MSAQSALVVLGCSATKLDVDGQMPAVHLYDGPFYRVLRSHLRGYEWSKNLSVGILSARHGLIGGLAQIATYDQRMTEHRALELHGTVSTTLSKLAETHSEVHLLLGKDYLRAVNVADVERHARLHLAEGPIGMKLQRFTRILDEHRQEPRSVRDVVSNGRPLYFLPDWDDFVDADFDFARDKFSAATRAERREVHLIGLLQPERLCDGILVSLAQNLGGGKGFLKRVPLDSPTLLRPRSLRSYFGLSHDQAVFGDCGAFSYSGEKKPSITVQQAVALYDLYEFDLGASVDHIPLMEINTPEGPKKLSMAERRARVRLTKENAAAFIDTCRTRRSSFTPVGVIQGIEPTDYAKQIGDYLEMGYTHLALGGLVPRGDDDISAIVRAVEKAISGLQTRPWIHLLGIFRPRLQELFRTTGIQSFDSATYFRKAWLRSDQNYLGTNGEWYSAIRVPPSDDARTLKRLKISGRKISTIQKHEKAALQALRGFARRRTGIATCVEAVLEYDKLLDRPDRDELDLGAEYRRTLSARPWDSCACNVCKAIGIDALIFRGYNRNKRRGAHNTLLLYKQLCQPRVATTRRSTTSRNRLSE